MFLFRLLIYRYITLVYISTCTNYTTQTIAEIYTRNSQTYILMAYSHCRNRIRTRTRIPNPMVTLYYVEIFTLVQIQIQIPVQRVFQIVTVPISGTDICPRDRSLSLFYTFQSENQSLDPNQCEISAQYRNLSPSRDPSPDPVM